MWRISSAFWTTLKRVGRTSITIHVKVEADRKGELIHVTEAEVTYVSVELADGVRRPVPIRGHEAESTNQAEKPDAQQQQQ